MSTAAIVTEGFGAFSTRKFVPTEGFFTTATPPPSPPPPPPVIGGAGRRRYGKPRNVILPDGSRVTVDGPDALQRLLDAYVATIAPDLAEEVEKPTKTQEKAARKARVKEAGRIRLTDDTGNAVDEFIARQEALTRQREAKESPVQVYRLKAVAKRLTPTPEELQAVTEIVAQIRAAMAEEEDEETVIQLLAEMLS